MPVQGLVIIIFAAIKEITSRNVNLFAPFIVVIDPESIGFADTGLLTYHKIFLASAPASTSPSTTATSWTAASTATTTISTACNAQQILCSKILLVDIVQKPDNRNTPVIFKKTNISPC